MASPEPPEYTTAPVSSWMSKETSPWKLPGVQTPVKTDPSRNVKVAVPVDPVVIVASERTAFPSADIVIAFPFHPSPHESFITSVYVNDAALVDASIGILVPPPQKARGLTAEGASHCAFTDDSPKNNEMLNSSNYM